MAQKLRSDTLQPRRSVSHPYKILVLIGVNFPNRKQPTHYSDLNQSQLNTIRQTGLLDTPMNGKTDDANRAMIDLAIEGFTR